MSYEPNEDIRREDYGANATEQAATDIPQAQSPYSKYDTLFAWLSVLMGFLLARALPVTQNTLGGTLMICLFFVFALTYVKLSGMKLNAKAVLFGAMIPLFSLGFLTGANRVIHRFLLLFIICVLLYWTYTVFNLNGRKMFGEGFVRHALTAIFVNPIISVIYIFPAFAVKDGEGRGGRILRTALRILIGLCCAVIPTAVIILLLSYDKGFVSLIDKIFSFSFEDIIECMGDLFLGSNFAMFIFGVLFGSKRRNRQSNGEPDAVKQAPCHVIPRSAICATVTPILLVYVVFFISQWDYYVPAFTRVLPDELTYAEYARSGFFQLCGVCAINAVMLLLFNLLIKRTEKKHDILRIVYSSLISVFSLILAATALSKMMLYIDCFGLTRKRVYATWLILLLCVAFVVVLLGQFIKRLPTVPVLAVTFILFFALISLPNVDAMIASYNVDAYRSGRIDMVDVVSMQDYGASAVPSLMELKEDLEKKENPSDVEKALLGRTNSTLSSIKAQLEARPDNVFTFNFYVRRAKVLLEDIQVSAPDVSYA